MGEREALGVDGAVRQGDDVVDEGKSVNTSGQRGVIQHGQLAQTKGVVVADGERVGRKDGAAAVAVVAVEHEVARTRLQQRASAADDAVQREGEPVGVDDLVAQHRTAQRRDQQDVVEQRQAIDTSDQGSPVLHVKTAGAQREVVADHDGAGIQVGLAGVEVGTVQRQGAGAVFVQRGAARDLAIERDVTGAENRHAINDVKVVRQRAQRAAEVAEARVLHGDKAGAERGVGADIDHRLRHEGAAGVGVVAVERQHAKAGDIERAGAGDDAVQRQRIAIHRQGAVRIDLAVGALQVDVEVTQAENDVVGQRDQARVRRGAVEQRGAGHRGQRAGADGAVVGHRDGAELQQRAAGIGVRTAEDEVARALLQKLACTGQFCRDGGGDTGIGEDEALRRADGQAAARIRERVAINQELKALEGEVIDHLHGAALTLEDANTVGLPIRVERARRIAGPVEGRRGPAAVAAIDDAVAGLVRTIPILHEGAGLGDDQVDLACDGVVLDEAGEATGQRQHGQAVVGERAIAEQVVDTEGEGATSAFGNGEVAVQNQVAGHDNAVVEAAAQRIGLAQLPLQVGGGRQVEVAVDGERAGRLTRRQDGGIGHVDRAGDGTSAAQQRAIADVGFKTSPAEGGTGGDDEAALVDVEHAVEAAGAGHRQGTVTGLGQLAAAIDRARERQVAVTAQHGAEGRRRVDLEVVDEVERAAGIVLHGSKVVERDEAGAQRIVGADEHAGRRQVGAARIAVGAVDEHRAGRVGGSAPAASARDLAIEGQRRAVGQDRAGQAVHHAEGADQINGRRAAGEHDVVAERDRLRQTNARHERRAVLGGQRAAADGAVVVDAKRAFIEEGAAIIGVDAGQGQLLRTGLAQGAFTLDQAGDGRVAVQRLDRAFGVQRDLLVDGHAGQQGQARIALEGDVAGAEARRGQDLGGAGVQEAAAGVGVGDQQLQRAVAELLQRRRTGDTAVQCQRGAAINVEPAKVTGQREGTHGGEAACRPQDAVLQTHGTKRIAHGAVSIDDGSGVDDLQAAGEAVAIGQRNAAGVTADNGADGRGETQRTRPADLAVEGERAASVVDGGKAAEQVDVIGDRQRRDAGDEEGVARHRKIAGAERGIVAGNNGALIEGRATRIGVGLVENQRATALLGDAADTADSAVEGEDKGLGVDGVGAADVDVILDHEISRAGDQAAGALQLNQTRAQSADVADLNGTDIDKGAAGVGVDAIQHEGAGAGLAELGAGHDTIEGQGRSSTDFDLAEDAAENDVTRRCERRGHRQFCVSKREIARRITQAAVGIDEHRGAGDAGAAGVGVDTRQGEATGKRGTGAVNDLQRAGSRDDAGQLRGTASHIDDTAGSNKRDSVGNVQAVGETQGRGVLDLDRAAARGRVVAECKHAIGYERIASIGVGGIERESAATGLLKRAGAGDHTAHGERGAGFDGNAGAAREGRGPVHADVVVDGREDGGIDGQRGAGLTEAGISLDGQRDVPDGGAAGVGVDAKGFDTGIVGPGDGRKAGVIDNGATADDAGQGGEAGQGIDVAGAGDGDVVAERHDIERERGAIGHGDVTGANGIVVDDRERAGLEIDTGQGRIAAGQDQIARAGLLQVDGAEQVVADAGGARGHLDGGRGVVEGDGIAAEGVAIDGEVDVADRLGADDGHSSARAGEGGIDVGHPGKVEVAAADRPVGQRVIPGAGAALDDAVADGIDDAAIPEQRTADKAGGDLDAARRGGRVDQREGDFRNAGDEAQAIVGERAAIGDERVGAEREAGQHRDVGGAVQSQVAIDSNEVIDPAADDIGGRQFEVDAGQRIKNQGADNHGTGRIAGLKDAASTDGEGASNGAGAGKGGARRDRGAANDRTIKLKRAFGHDGWAGIGVGRSEHQRAGAALVEAADIGVVVADETAERQRVGAAIDQHGLAQGDLVADVEAIRKRRDAGGTDGHGEQVCAERGVAADTDDPRADRNLAAVAGIVAGQRQHAGRCAGVERAGTDKIAGQDKRAAGQAGLDGKLGIQNEVVGEHDRASARIGQA